MFDFDLKFGRATLKSLSPYSLVPELISSWKPEIEISNILELSGGYSNFNFKVESNHGRFVCRVSHKGKEQLLIESKLSKKLNHSFSPKILYVGELNGKCFSIAEFVEGDLLSEVWKGLEQSTLEKILIDLGHKASIIHNCKFSQSGFFDSKLNVTEEFKGGVGSGYYDFIESSLKNDLVVERLGAELLKDVLKLITLNRPLFEAVNSHKSLVHSDFNTKNIMVSVQRQCVTGILDWEYAHSGTPLCDFSNFLRFEDETDFNVSDYLIKGYGEGDNLFIKDWRKISYLLDLASMFGFLTREYVHEATLKTAKKVIQETISRIAVR